MVDSVISATQAHVTLDVAVPGVVWGWIITMNMWAKSIATGVIFIGALLLSRHSQGLGNLVKVKVPIISLIFIHITLLFTVLDLHQMFRFWHIFVYPNFTSAITVGAWAVTGFVGLLFLMAYASIIKKDDALFKTFMWLAFILAIPSTLYTAVIMGESTARELWQTPGEMIQMILSATLAGSATLLIVGGDLSNKIKKELGFILALSGVLSFMIYMGEYAFGHIKAEEIGVVLAAIKEGGDYSGLFWLGQSLAYIIPFILVFFSMKLNTSSLYYLASVLALVGLWMTKHVWLIIPQLIPMS